MTSNCDNNQLCLKTSNNQYPDSPALMSDGRTFTDYRQSCAVNNLLRTNSNSFNSHEYRMFLIRNAKHLIDLNRNLAFERNRVGPCMEPYNVGTMLPEKTKVNCDHHGCIIQVNDETGLGQGRQYNSFPEISFPVNLGNKNIVNCCATPLNNFEHYGLDKVQGDIVELTDTTHNGIRN
jgi:hypothetical protein|tara:strand:- start:131 stop:664 length:534 start_codon:yes stop_codon:yes gene_type:complete